MANILDKVKTVVLLMFENRSFDHMLGHLSFENLNDEVDGLKMPLSNFNNIYKGDTYKAYSMLTDTQLAVDLPHEYNEVSVQLAKSGVSEKFTMSGFVESYAKKTGLTPNPQCQPMGFFNSAQVPVSSFLARTFCTCDRWFSPIPTSTQPNRSMAFSGDSNLHATSGALIDVDNDIFNWMTKAGIRWRVYHDGLSFFTVYPRLWQYVFGNNFRRYEALASDILDEAGDTAPQVIIIEPSYQDAPHIGSDMPNDNHPPLAIGWGEEFLRNTYRALIANTKKWEGTVMITYYDEHGGFYDHVAPPNIAYQTKEDPPYSFESLGPRVPAIIASPLVKPSSVCHSLFDHTSVLHFLTEKFAPGNFISETVHERNKQGIESITAALNNDVPWPAPPPSATTIFVQAALGHSIQTAPESDVAKSFEIAANNLIQQRPDDTKRIYPELFLWKEVVAGTFLNNGINNIQTSVVNDMDSLKNKEQVTRLFILYASEDRKEKNILVNTYLKSIQHHYGDSFITWTEAEIKAGTDWDKQIKLALGAAEVILFLITPNFLASGYTKNTGIKAAIGKFKAKKQLIIPVYIERVSKYMLPFKNKQYLPGDTPLKEWKPQKTGWTKITDGLITVINDLKAGNAIEYF